ncbi:glycosyltransferase family A protein [Methylococcus capsulatus]|uniref:glycosyltransferase family 2 protein n=1 Tax=Methylococcus capsulatus TaxID=414 RepID=UPI002FDA4200
MLLVKIIKNIFNEKSKYFGTSQCKVSVLIPAYNHELYVEETVRSIWDQNYPNFEIVAVDDASGDDTFAILEGLRKISPIPMRVYKNEVNRGPAFTLNRAASMASGDLFIPFSSDDLFLPGRIERQVDILKNNSDLYILYCNGHGLDDSTNTRKGVCHTPHAIELLQKDAKDVYLYLITHKNCIFVHTSMIRRSLFEAVGGYDETMLAEDWSLNVKIFRYLSALPDKHYAFCDEPVFEYRVHAAQNFRNDKRQLESKWRMIERYTPDHLKLQASNNIILGHLDAPWCRLTDTERAEQLIKLVRFHASLGEWSSVLRLCSRYVRLYPDNEDLRFLKTAAENHVHSNTDTAPH